MHKERLIKVADRSPVILWFRKDLRLDDNLALLKAVKSGRPILPVYIMTPPSSPYAALGGAQAWWLHHSLESLARALTEKGSRLILRRGEPFAVLSELVRETGAEVIAVNRLHEPKAEAEDRRLSDSLSAQHIAFHAYEGALLHDAEKLLTGSGGGFRVYTPFWRALVQQAPPSPPLEAPGGWPHPEAFPDSLPLESLGLLPVNPNWASRFGEMWQPGEKGALSRLKTFCAGALNGYAVMRDRPGTDGTSGLSPHLALGEISPRRIWQAVEREKEKGPDGEDISRYLKEVVWREFSYHLLHHFPDLATRNWNSAFDTLEWRDDETGFTAWTRGMTGYPIVDAGMRQLWQHGWMHNRVRMIAASFLIKDLLIDWRLGEEWFRDTLVDADPASNSASWQWVAGSGADASPFFRIFNPILQGEKFDGSGAYIRKYVPELAGLPDALIHKPFEASLIELRAAGITLGKTYPLPVVDHRMARDRALAALSRLKDENNAPVKKIRNG